MDISEVYIKMCGGAMEIQRRFDKSSGANVFAHFSLEKRRFIVTEYIWAKPGIPDFNWSPGGFSIWLPRQDQLQEIIGNFPDIIDKFYLFCGEFAFPEDTWEGLSNYCKQFTSMEQLWLALVMKAVYKKVWDGEEWIDKINSGM